ncbi:MAG: NAD(P)-dependent oxidoreductase [Cyanobacteria bacterium RM1_2_2]|nr:NAD(P)-dependent oxidoreductase [Cyanobacteria bacterium RM1_2_2]
MQKLLLTGASGFLGWHLCQLTQANWDVYGTYYAHAVDIPGVKLLPVDLTDFVALKQLVQTIQPDAIIHTAALSSPNACEADPEASYQINVVASCNLAGLSAEAEIPCVFTSSEQVFDGSKPPYREADPVCPINRYGEHKAAAEAGMQERCPTAIICRMPLMFGVAPTAKSFIQPWIETLRNGGSIHLFTDEIRNPVSGYAAAQGLLIALEKASSILHLGGKERLSRYAIGSLLAEVLGVPETQLNPCQQADVKMAAPRPLDASLDSSLAFSLGYQPKSIKEELASLKAVL